MHVNSLIKIILPACLAALVSVKSMSAEPAIDRYSVVDLVFETTVEYDNPYVELDPEAALRCPDGKQRRIPLFWDGGRKWRLRVSPDLVGRWTFRIESRDSGLRAQHGGFVCVESDRRGSIEPIDGATHHFQYRNGERMWFLGDTAWALFTDNAGEKHDRAAADRYLRRRAGQGFNVVHSMMLSEAGWGNSGGPPFHNMRSQAINPRYWQEVDYRIELANEHGLVVGLAIAWGDKRKVEPYAWRRFPDLEARKRYARYIAARYSAYDVYFIVSGEWHGEVRTRGSSESQIKREFTEIGDALAEADPHDRMVAIHPMTRHGSVREFNDTGWMSFGDYQQNYAELHSGVLKSRVHAKPVVNSEYGYHLRDRDGNGTPDKDNSTSLESIRHASWDIVMAGGYLVTGFGTTYFGGNRDPGPFNVDAAQNQPWELQIGVIKQVLESCRWWKMEPHDQWITSRVPRGKDGRQLGRLAPPATTYWLLAEPNSCYLVYARGVTVPLNIRVGSEQGDRYKAQSVNLRTGRQADVSLRSSTDDGMLRWTPPDEHDWILKLTREE